VDCYRPVTCYQTILRTFTDARYLIDKALTKALKHRKPVLLEVCRCAELACDALWSCMAVMTQSILPANTGLCKLGSTLQQPAVGLRQQASRPTNQGQIQPEFCN
jgi:hypothetical protein